MYFYWTLRLRNEAIWFKHLLEEIALEDTEGLLEINIHVTSIRKANDIRVTLLRLAQTKVAEQQGMHRELCKKQCLSYVGSTLGIAAFSKPTKLEEIEYTLAFVSM